MLKSPVKVAKYVNGRREIIDILPLHSAPDLVQFTLSGYWNCPYCIGFNESTREYNSYDEYGMYDNESDDNPEDLVELFELNHEG
jgi:hypothetical protein